MRFDLLAAGLFALLPLYGQADASTTPAGLIATLQADCRRVGVGDEIALTMTLRNAGSTPLVLYRQMGWGEGGGLGLRVDGFDGTAYAVPASGEVAIDAAKAGDAGNYLMLLPQRALQVVRHATVAELVPGPGNYRVQAEYRSPVAAAEALPRAYFWPREAGVVASTALSLEVGESPVCGLAAQGG
ncbi:MAG TPA: hypothetical protein VGC74_03460 [Stenotrophomonas sp.]|jgi:hypothetical protein